MKKGSFRGNTEKLVRLLPRPKMDGKLIAKTRNSWLIVEECGQADGIVVLNKVTEHGGQIPYDSIRKWQEPDMVILSAQVNVGKDGFFEVVPFLDGPETEMLIEAEAFVPERLEFAKAKLDSLSQQETEVLRRLVVQGRTPAAEILKWCLDMRIATDGYTLEKFFTPLMNKTQLIEKDNPHLPNFVAWIKQEFVSILEQLLLSPLSRKSSMDR
jgi:hypothetical protein